MSVHEILSAITEAKSALDREPEYRGRISTLEGDLNRAYEHSQLLEINTINYKQQIENLSAKCRSLEVERDDASFRLLEAEDRLDGYKRLAYTLASNIDGTLRNFRMDEEKLVPQSQSEPNPAPSFEEMKASAQPPHPVEAAGESASPLSPTVVDTPPSQSASVSGAQDLAPVVLAPKPYEGKTYSEVFGVGPGCSMQDWEKGGGEYYKYYH